MHCSGTFKVENFAPASVTASSVDTAIPVGISRLNKRYQGDVSGRSTTLFTSAFDGNTTSGTYVAMESFEGSLHGKQGSFNFAHSATTSGGGRENEFFRIVPGSGTAELAGIEGSGGIVIELDGTHRVWFDYEFAPDMKPVFAG